MITPSFVELRHVLPSLCRHHDHRVDQLLKDYLCARQLYQDAPHTAHWTVCRCMLSKQHDLSLIKIESIIDAEVISCVLGSVLPVIGVREHGSRETQKKTCKNSLQEIDTLD